MHALELTSDDEPLLRARRLEHVACASEPTLGVASAEKQLREALAVYRAHGDRDGIATAAFGVGRLLRAQTRFREAVDLADDLLAEVGEAEDKATVVLLLLRGPDTTHHALAAGKADTELLAVAAELESRLRIA